MSDDYREPNSVRINCTASTLVMRLKGGGGGHHEGHVNVWTADERAGEVRLLVGRGGWLSSLRWLKLRLNGGQPAAAALRKLGLPGLRSVG